MKMYKFSFRISSMKKFLVLFWSVSTVLYIFYGEFLIYQLKKSTWLSMNINQEKDCTRILLVADPQIIGNINEIFHPVTPFSIFDSDRYLKITYNQVFNFVQPHIVIFLGDLMDEAHIANDRDFYDYIRRIFNIFVDPYNDYQDIKYIWLPGDNDIGGENTPITPKKLERFDQAFTQSDIQNYKNITLFKINHLNNIVPVYKKERDFFDTSKIFIGLSHIPLMFRPSPFTETVINKMMPHILFTAHEHKSMIISTDALLHKDHHIIPISPDNTKIYSFNLGTQDMYEILIPTCSYRMGTNKIGYGFALIENNNELKFTILWSPSRFQQLFVYLFLIVVPLTSYLIYKICACIPRSLKLTLIKKSRFNNKKILL